MKKFYFTLIFFLSVFISFAAPRTLITAASGDWNKNGTWSLNRIPQDGDSIVIPQGVTVTFTIKDATLSNVYIVVNGTLIMNQASKLKLEKPSVLYVGTTGQIRTDNPGKDNSQKINMETYRGPIFEGKGTYNGVKGILNGPLMISTGGSGWQVPPQNIPTPLPVKFASFTVARQQNTVLVQWSTASESNSKSFEIERSANGSTWTTIASVKAAGESSSLLAYAYNDRTVTGAVAYYRIKQVDLDGAYTYTDVRSIKLDNNQVDVKVIPASANTLYVNFSQQVQAAVVLRLTSMTGQVISQQQVSNPVGQVQFSAPNHNTGIYILTITDNKNMIVSKQVLL